MPLIESLKGLDEMRTVKIELTKEEIDLLDTLLARNYHDLEDELEDCGEDAEEEYITTLKTELDLTEELWKKINIAWDKIHRVWEANLPRYWTV